MKGAKSTPVRLAYEGTGKVIGMNYGEIYGPIYQAVILKIMPLYPYVRPLLATYVQAACVCRMCMPHVHAAFLFLLLGSGHEAGDDAVAKS